MTPDFANLTNVSSNFVLCAGGFPKNLSHSKEERGRDSRVHHDEYGIYRLSPLERTRPTDVRASTWL